MWCYVVNNPQHLMHYRVIPLNLQIQIKFSFHFFFVLSLVLYNALFWNCLGRVFYTYIVKRHLYLFHFADESMNLRRRKGGFCHKISKLLQRRRNRKKFLVLNYHASACNQIVISKFLI